MKSVAVGMTADIMMDGQAAMEEEQDLEFAESSMPASIKMIEGLLKADPGNQDLLILMAKVMAAMLLHLWKIVMKHYKKILLKKQNTLNRKQSVFIRVEKNMPCRF